jgi:hypothetical protein
MAKQAKVSTARAPKTATVVPTPTARMQRQQQAAKRRQQQNLWLYGGIAFFVLLIGLVVYLNIRSSQPVAGEQALASQGNYHIEMGSPAPLAYNSTPPTSGPHYGSLAAWNIYDEPQRYELLIHNMEDGGVIVYYQCADGCPETVAQLKAVVEPYLATGRHVVMAPNDPTWTIGSSQPLHQDMGAKIVLTAWTRMLKLDEFDETKIRTFIDRYEGIDHHVAGIG